MQRVVWLPVKSDSQPLFVSPRNQAFRHTRVCHGPHRSTAVALSASWFAGDCHCRQRRQDCDSGSPDRTRNRTHHSHNRSHSTHRSTRRSTTDHSSCSATGRSNSSSHTGHTGRMANRCIQCAKGHGSSKMDRSSHLCGLQGCTSRSHTGRRIVTGCCTVLRQLLHPQRRIVRSRSRNRLLRPSSEQGR